MSKFLSHLVVFSCLNFVIFFFFFLFNTLTVLLLCISMCSMCPHTVITRWLECATLKNEFS